MRFQLLPSNGLSETLMAGSALQRSAPPAPTWGRIPKRIEVRFSEIQTPCNFLYDKATILVFVIGCPKASRGSVRDVVGISGLRGSKRFCSLLPGRQIPTSYQQTPIHPKLRLYTQTLNSNSTCRTSWTRWPILKLGNRRS